MHPDGAIDFAYPAPQPAPFTTIAWRLAHVIVGVLAMRNHSTSAGPPADYQTLARTPPTRRRRCTSSTTRTRTGSPAYAALDAEALTRPIGPAEGPYAEHPMSRT